MLLVSVDARSYFKPHLALAPQITPPEVALCAPVTLGKALGNPNHLNNPNHANTSASLPSTSVDQARET